MSLPALLDLAATSGVVGTFLPILVAMVNQEHWSSKAKGLVTAGLSTAAGLITAWGDGDFRGASPLVAVIVVLLTASVAFHAFWAPTRLADLIETATTFARTHLPAHADAPVATNPAFPAGSIAPPANAPAAPTPTVDGGAK